MADGAGTLGVYTVEAGLDYESTAQQVVDVTLNADANRSVELPGAAERAVALAGEPMPASLAGIVVEDTVVADPVISDPGDVSVQTVLSSDFVAMEANTEDGHAQPKLETIDPDAETFTTSGNWPVGTWEQGHFDGSTDWYQTAHASGNYFGAHVRVRRSAEFGRGYVWALFLGFTFFGRGPTRIKNAVDYLQSVQIVDDPFDSSRDGSWISWTWRKNRDELILNEDYWATTTPNDNRVDLNWFAVGRALAFISLAYVQAVQNGTTVAGDTDYTAPLDNGITNLLTETGSIGVVPGNPNANYHAAALWGLVQAHKAGRTVGMANIEAWAQALVDSQDTDPASDHYGAFYHPDNTDDDGDPVQTFYHDTKVHYLAIDTRALAEAAMVLPAGSVRTAVVEALVLVINHIIDTRFAADNSLKTNYKTTGGDDPNASNSDTQKLELMLVAFCRVYVFAETQGEYTATDRERILTAAHRLADGLEPFLSSRYGFAGWACYQATLDWIDGGAVGTDILMDLP